MKQNKGIKALQIILATALIVAGIAVCALGISIHIVYLYDRYQHFANHHYYDSFLQYYLAVGKGNVAISLLIGAIPVGIGIAILRWKRKETVK